MSNQSERDTALRTIATDLRRRWIVYLDVAHGSLDSTAPHLSGNRWTDAPFASEIWRRHRASMDSFAIFPEDVEAELNENPERYPPVQSSLGRSRANPSSNVPLKPVSAARVNYSKLDLIIEKYGWENMIAADFEPLKDFLRDFEATGIEWAEFRSNPEKFDPKMRVIQRIARNLRAGWIMYVNSPKPRDSELPHLTGKPWTEAPFPRELWLPDAEKSLMQKYGIAEEDIDQEIRQNANRYPLVESFDSIRLNARRRREEVSKGSS